MADIKEDNEKPINLYNRKIQIKQKKAKRDTEEIKAIKNDRKD